MRRKTAGLRNWWPRHFCLVTCLLLAAAGLLAVCGGPLGERFLVSYYERQLTDGDGGQAEELLGRLATLGRPGIATIARALGSPRPAMRELAYRTLMEQLNRYEQSPTQSTTALALSDMAQALADAVQQVRFGERARVEALAMKIVALAEAVPLADRGDVIASCQQVLSAREEKRRSVQAASLAPLRMAPVPRPRIAGKKPPPEAHEKPTPRLHLATLSPPALRRADAQTSAEPNVLMPNDVLALAKRPERPRQVQKGEQVQVAAFTAGSQAADEERAAREQARQVDVIELFNQLHAGEPGAEAARAELAARGFSPRQVEVGEHLVSPDAAERLQWTEWLPGIRGVDARFWLLRLSHDPNPHVRRAAVGLLATDRDPEVVRRLQRVAVEDPDERIRVQAGRALEVLGEP